MNKLISLGKIGKNFLLEKNTNLSTFMEIAYVQIIC